MIDYLKATLCFAAAMTVAQPAVAQTGAFGSAQQSTYRSCAGVDADKSCGFVGDGVSNILQEVYGGGLGQYGSANLEIDRPGTDNDAFARSTVSRGAFYLPAIRGETRSGVEDRMNINAFGFQSYSWTGDAATPFSLEATLHIVDSGTQQGYATTVPGGGSLPGGALYDAYVAVWDPSIIAGYTSAQDLIANLLLARCGTAGVLGVGRQSSVSLRGGEFSTTLTTSECTQGSLTLQPGQEILSVAALRLPTNRGGFADATHTFTTAFDQNLSADVRASLAQNLVAATELPGVPEPATWAMMIAGFGLVGGAMRRREPVLA